MIIINNQEEMEPYYNEETNTYEFIENNRLIDIKIDFDLNIESSNIEAGNIEAWDIKARNINALDINALDIKARDIRAENIKAWDIKANKISFNAVCFAYKTFVCNAIRGRRENSKYFCLDSEVVIENQKS